MYGSIYKCSVYDTTWNLTVLSRVNPCSILPKTLQRFYNNDPDLVMVCASDISLIKKNGGEPGLPAVDIDGITVDLTEPVRIHLSVNQPTEIRVLSVLREKLGISRNEIIRMCDSGRLRCVSGKDITKCKLADEIVIEIK